MQGEQKGGLEEYYNRRRGDPQNITESPQEVHQTPEAL
jgi:hypothetical protein